MGKGKSAQNLNEKGLAVAGLTSDTLADDTTTHPAMNQESSSKRKGAK